MRSAWNAERGASSRTGRIARPRCDAVSAAFLALLLLLLPACSTYQIQGKVIEGTASSVSVVDAKDPRLQEPGMPGVAVHGILDPRELGQKRLPTATTSGSGEFSLPVEEAGAGLLKFTVQIVGRRPGYQSAENTFPLPGGKRRVLITLTRGRDTHAGQPGDVLEETLRMSEPYMRE